MPIKSRLRIALAAGACVFILNLLVEWLLNRELVKPDFLISVLAGVFVILVVFLLLRHVPKRDQGNN
ncbi:MAG: hypothetical protein FWC25_01800 [Dehalococcoidia bacterium]|nr:hypothetical protein [Dehalococcoidia bacterium]